MNAKGMRTKESGDTSRCRRDTALRALFLWGLAAGAVAPPPSRAADAPISGRPLDARVAWTRGDRVYVAATDSIAVAARDTLVFVENERVVGTAAVDRVLDRDLALARLVTGALAAKELDRLAVLVRPAAPTAPPRALRLGLPANSRANLLLLCPPTRLRAPAGWRLSNVGRDRMLVRDSSTAEPASWPETLVVRLFPDAADQEIALQRGEIDLGVFWPGEVSRHLRERWAGFPTAASRTLLAVPAGTDTAALGELRDALFRGDLEPMRPWGPEVEGVVLARVPGERSIARTLTRDGAPPARLPVLIRPGSAATFDPGARMLGPSAYRDGRWFEPRYPVLAAPELRERLQAIDPASWLELLDCAP